MLGKIAGALIGNRLAGRNQGLKGAALGTAATSVLSRARLGPLGTALLFGWGAKKVYDWNKQRRSGPSYPSDAAPASRRG